jgi:hypothetical protein
MPTELRQPSVKNAFWTPYRTYPYTATWRASFLGRTHGVKSQQQGEVILVIFQMVQDERGRASEKPATKGPLE